MRKAKTVSEESPETSIANRFLTTGADQLSLRERGYQRRKLRIGRGDGRDRFDNRIYRSVIIVVIVTGR